MDAPAKPPADLYINRELSQLEFHKRVFAQAQDPAVPLLERLRFLCITCTNLDEFFEIRVAVLKQQIEIRRPHPGSRQAVRKAGVRRIAARHAGAGATAVPVAE